MSAVSLPRLLDRALTWTGFAGILAAFFAIFATAAAAPWFSWTDHALSHLGDPDRWSLFWLYNWGLAVAGILGSLFVARAALAFRTTLHRLASVVLAATMVDLTAIGLFPVGHPLHGPVSVAFFVGLTYGLFLYGSGDVLAGRRHRGLVFVWLAIAHVTGWAVWQFVPWDGVAVPELGGAVVLAVWTITITRALTVEAAGRRWFRRGPT